MKFLCVTVILIAAAAAEVLFSSARIRYTSDDNSVHDVQLQNVEYFDHQSMNGSQLRITTKSMPMLWPNTFRNMPNLRILRLPKCGIREIKPKAFVELPNLDRIQLQDNNVIRIENGVFNDMNISQLYLQRNKIVTIDSEAFDNMPNLHTIKLNANQIRAWNGDWFFNSPKLTNLYFRRNFITTLDEDSFKNIKKLQVGYEENQNSTNIYLSKNKLTTVHPQALSDIVRLNNFYLDRNNLTELPQNLFDGVESIAYLSLRRNKIAKLSELLFAKTARIGTLDLVKNELECIPKDFVRRARKVMLEDNQITCVCMAELQTVVKNNETLPINECIADDGNEVEDDEEEDEEMNDAEEDDEVEE